MDLLQSSDTRKKVFKLGLTLTPAQKVIDDAKTRFKIVRCGRKFGKTTYAEKKALDWMSPPNSVVWYISPTIKQGKIIAWMELKRMIPQEALGKKPNDTDLVITLKNGSQLYLMGAEDPDSLRGPAPNGVIFEEAAFIRREAWHEVVRPNLAPKKAPALFIGTPKGYNWFYDLEQAAKENPDEWSTFHYSIYDNPHIDKDEIQACRKSCDSDAVWNQEYMALYESSVGRVFAALDQSKHTASLPVPVGNVYRSVDWGMRDNTAVLWGYLKDKKLYVYREYLENNLSAPQQAEMIKRMTTPHEKVVSTAISHDAAKQDPAMKGLTVIWHFQNAGITPLRPSTRKKENSRQMLNDLIRQDRLIIDKGRCPKLWKQLMTYEWKDTTMETPGDTPDDAVDALHYLVEMLQFDLFLGGRIEVKRSIADIIADHEKKISEFHNFPLHVKKDEGLELNGSQAGYVR